MVEEGSALLFHYRKNDSFYADTLMSVHILNKTKLQFEQEKLENPVPFEFIATNHGAVVAYQYNIGDSSIVILKAPNDLNKLVALIKLPLK